jgi:hypothetical protein
MACFWTVSNFSARTPIARPKAKGSASAVETSPPNVSQTLCKAGFAVHLKPTSAHKAHPKPRARASAEGRYR